jgi:FixJ family two-component response regulator
MGTMGGVELRDRLAKTHPSLPVLLMSGHGTEELVGRRMLGAEEPVLQKPFDITQLAQRIRALLDTRGAPL